MCKIVEGPLLLSCVLHSNFFIYLNLHYNLRIIEVFLSCNDVVTQKNTQLRKILESRSDKVQQIFD